MVKCCCCFGKSIYGGRVSYGWLFFVVVLLLEWAQREIVLTLWGAFVVLIGHFFLIAVASMARITLRSVLREIQVLQRRTRFLQSLALSRNKAPEIWREDDSDTNHDNNNDDDDDEDGSSSNNENGIRETDEATEPMAHDCEEEENLLSAERSDDTIEETSFFKNDDNEESMEIFQATNSHNDSKQQQQQQQDGYECVVPETLLDYTDEKKQQDGYECVVPETLLDYTDEKKEESDQWR